MLMLHSPGPWHMLVYINENDERFPPHIVGLWDNYDVADCCGANDIDLANGRLIAAAPELLQACEAAIRALAENSPESALSEVNVKAVNMCRAARDKAYKP